MSTPVDINSVVIQDGPLPVGQLVKYGYDPATSCAFLVKLESYQTQVENTLTQQLKSPALINSSNLSEINITNVAGMTVDGAVVYIHIASIDPDLLVELVIDRVNNADNTLEYLNVGLNAIMLLGTSAVSAAKIRVTRADDVTHASRYVVINYIDIQFSSSYTKLCNTFDQFAVTYTGTNWTIIAASVQGTSSQLLLGKDFSLPNNGTIKNDITGALVYQILAPFPPAFYDADWYEPITYGALPVSHVFSEALFNSYFSRMDRVLLDTHIKSDVSCFDLAFRSTDLNGNSILLFPYRRQISSGPVTYGVSWYASEDVYKYKCQGILFGGRNQAGPLNSVFIPGTDNDFGTTHRILNLNEFRVNNANEVEVDAYIGNYNSTAPRVYCVLNKATGKMAEIIPSSRTVNYFTVSVPLDSEILNLYYTTRLMYTVRNINTNAMSLYDAHSNGVLLHTFNLGTYQPNTLPTFTVIN